MAEDARPDQPDLAPARKPEEKAKAEPLDSQRERLEEEARRTRAKANRYAARHLGDGLQGEEILDEVLQSAIAAASRSSTTTAGLYLLWIRQGDSSWSYYPVLVRASLGN